MSSMCSPTLLSLFCSLFFFQFSFSSAFNVTTMLEKHPEFSTFNDLLSRTKVAENINKRQTITVLAVENGAASSLSGMSLDDATKRLNQHVILDYYDEKKLEKLNKTSKLTTLYQASGQAQQQQGFLNVEVTSNGVAFGSAASESRPNINLVKSVASQPYNISILQVSGVIDQSSGTSSAPTSSPGSSKTAPAQAPRSSGANAPSEDSPSDADAPSEDSGAPSKAASPSDDSSPPDASSPSESAADEPKGGEKASGAPAIAMLGSSVKIGIMFLMVYIL